MQDMETLSKALSRSIERKTLGRVLFSQHNYMYMYPDRIDNNPSLSNDKRIHGGVLESLPLYLSVVGLTRPTLGIASLKVLFFLDVIS